MIGPQQYIMRPNACTVDPENIILFTKNELPSIFSNYGKPFSNATLDVEIGLKCRRRIYGGAELLIEMNKSFSSYDIEIYSKKDHKPFIKCKYDREIFFANNLEENFYYVAGQMKSSKFISKNFYFTLSKVF